MPRFPSYSHHKIPKRLHLFKPSHYALFAYWIYFRPMALKCYFHQSLPGLFETKEPIGFWGKWKTPAYRNLFVMMPIVSMLLSAVLGGTVALASAWKFDVPIDWNRWLDGGMLGIALGMTIGMAFGTVGRVFGGPVQGTMVSTVYAVTIGVMGGVSLSISSGLPFADLTEGVEVVGAVLGILGGMAFTLDLEIGLALSLAFAVMALLSFGAGFLLQHVFGLTLGALVARGVMSAAFVIGAFRLPVYLLQCVLAFGGLRLHRLHPVLWDELTILPLPCTRIVLSKMLRQDETYGLRLLTDVSRNHFRRNDVHAVLYRYVHRHPTPLRFLYELLHTSIMNEYLLLPLNRQHQEHYADVRYVILGELALRPVEAMKHPRVRRSSRSLKMRLRKQTALTDFAGMLFDFLTESSVQQDRFDLRSYESIFQSVLHDPDGEEICLSYECMAAFLSYLQLEQLPEAEKLSAELSRNVYFEEAVRPTVLIALSMLGNVGKNIAPYLHSTNPQVQLMALARATADLNDIHEYVTSEVLFSEQAILLRIIQHWQQLILSAIGRFGQSKPRADLQMTFHAVSSSRKNDWGVERRTEGDPAQISLPFAESS